MACPSNTKRRSPVAKDPSLRRETDLLILDHLTYDATTSLLKYTRSSPYRRKLEKRHVDGAQTHGTRDETEADDEDGLPDNVSEKLEMVKCM